MPAKPFHLGWFQTFQANEWKTPYTLSEGVPFTGDFYVELAQALERACFDFLMLEDTVGIPRGLEGTTARALENGDSCPKQDPVPLAAKVGALTRQLGIVATMSTTFYHPYALARLASTMDSLTSYIDPSKVHDVDFVGKHFKSRGPLTCVRSPQGRPVYLQAGGSPAGRAFAAKHADAIIAWATGVEGMKEYRADIREQATAAGRDPDDVKVMFLFSPILGETEAEARAKVKPMSEEIPARLKALSSNFYADFTKMDLDEPVPYFVTRGEQGSLAGFAQWGTAKTLRQCMQARSAGGASSFEAIGTPDQVADIMAAAMEEVGGDGFLFPGDGGSLTRHRIIEICDGLVPALQARGLTRTSYSHTLLRDNLRAF